MYQMLRVIATELVEALEIPCIVFPYSKVLNEPQIELKPAGTSVYLRGSSKNISCDSDAESFFSFTLELAAFGKSEELLESFYEADMKCDKEFSKRKGMINVNGVPGCSVEFKKRVNGGIYGEILDGQETNTQVYEFREIWDCTARYRTYT